MKRSYPMSIILFVLAGLLVGGILPMPWDEAAPVLPSPIVNTQKPAGSAASSDTVPAINTQLFQTRDNFTLLSTACSVLQQLKQQDYTALAALVHPKKGVTFTPYSTVEREADRNFTPAEIRNLNQDKTVYTWGRTDGRGSLIQLSMAQYFAQYVFSTDFTQAGQIGIDRVVTSGNALENLTEAYPGCRFVDFYVPGLDATNHGLDWLSLKLVFEAGDTGWLLVGIIHGQWTI